MSEDVQEMSIADTYRELWRGLKTLKPIHWFAVVVSLAISMGFMGLMIYLAEHNINAFIYMVWGVMVLCIFIWSFLIVALLRFGGTDADKTDPAK